MSFRPRNTHLLTNQVSTYGSDAGAGNRRSYYGSMCYLRASRIRLTLITDGSTMSPPRQQRPGGGGYYRSSSYGGFTHQQSVMEDPQEAQYYGRQQRQPLQPSQNNYQNGNGYHNGYDQGPHMSAHSHQQSYETMTSGSDENSKSTNPSSLNSSYDQLHQVRKPADNYYQQQQQPQKNQYADEMDFAPVGQPKAYDQYGRSEYGQQYGGPVRGPPAPPPKANNPRVPIKLDGGSSMPTATLSKTNSGEGKRQSWIKRKFSKKEKY